MPGLLDANLCKNKQTNNNVTMLMSILYHSSLFKVLYIVCFCLFLHKLTSNKPGIYSPGEIFPGIFVKYLPFFL